MKSDKKQNKFLAWFRSSTFDFVLFVIAIVLLNLIGLKAFGRIDLTKSKTYTLSQSSRQIVKTMDSPLSVKVFFSPKLPAQQELVAQYVRDLLAEYKNAANKNFSVEYINMKKEENEELAQQYGLRPFNIRELQKNKMDMTQVYMGMAISYEDQIQTIDTIVSQEGLEYKITNAIEKLIISNNLLAGLPAEMKMTLYLTDELVQAKILDFDAVQEKISQAYEKNHKIYGDKLSYTIASPKDDDAMAVSEKYGLPAMNMRNPEGGLTYGVFGLVLETGDSFRVVPLGISNEMFFGWSVYGLDELEENIQETVKSLVSKTTTIGYIVGHGEKKLSDEQEAAIFRELIEDYYSLKEIDLSKDKIPSAVNTVLINGGTQEWSDSDLYVLDQFLMKGGNILFFRDSFLKSEQNMYGYSMPVYEPFDSGLEKLLSKYGIEIGKAYVLDEECYQSGNSNYGKMNYYYVPVLKNDQMNQKHVISKNLGFVLFLEASPIDITGASGNPELKTTVLAKSSPKSWLLNDQIILSPMYNEPPSDENEFDQYNLAVIAEGNFSSAFDGPVEENDDEMISSGHVSKSIQPGKIFVASTSEITGPQILNQNNIQDPIALFLRNAVDYMNGNEDMARMRTKGSNFATLRESSDAKKSAAQIFNEVAIPVIVLMIGLALFLVRKFVYRYKIMRKFNSKDSREMKR